MEGQTEFNKNGEINAIPIVSYHQIGKGKDYDDLPEFEHDMEYLHDNEFKVINLDDLGYNNDKEYFYIKNVNNSLMK